MATVAIETERPAVEPVGLLLTVADLAQFPSELPSGPVDYELDNGRIIFMAPPGGVHGYAQSKITTALNIQGEQRGLGQAYGEVGVVLWRNPDRVVGPDAAFITTPSLPVRYSPEGYLETIPDLVVEIRSKNDTPAYLQRKIDDYFAAGVRVIWIADPETRTITVHRAKTTSQTLAAKEELTIPEVIPGFAVKVGELFPV